MNPHDESPELHELRMIRQILEKLMGQQPSEQPAQSGRRRTPAQVRARHFLRSQLLDGPLSWEALVVAGGEFGHSEGTLRRARPGIAEIEHQKDGAPPLWRLKEEVRQYGA